MIYSTCKGDIDLSKVLRLYPAVLIDMQGEVAEMSLEWIDIYGEKVKTLSFLLVFDFTQVGDKERTKVTLEFDTREELIEEMQKVAQFFN